MKFILVNGRSPRRESFCSLCYEPIGESYLRELTTRLSFCNYDCSPAAMVNAPSAYAEFMHRIRTPSLPSGCVTIAAKSANWAASHIAPSTDSAFAALAWRWSIRRLIHVFEGSVQIVI